MGSRTHPGVAELIALVTSTATPLRRVVRRVKGKKHEPRRVAGTDYHETMRSGQPLLSTPSIAKRSEEMRGGDYKHYTAAARRGIRGEAFFESLIVDHAIPHRIARQNDLGVDFLCEWTHGDRPTGILFSAQVKATTSDSVDTSLVGTSKLNLLEEHTLTGAENVDERTINYWKGLSLPAFLFYVVETRAGGFSRLECFHKRYTPLLDGHPDSDDLAGTKRFYRVSNGSTFLAFPDPEKEIGGFARDLIIDYARLSYSKGHVIPLKPDELGFWPFPNKSNPDATRYFGELVKWHRSKIEETCDWAKGIVTRLPAK